MSAQWAAQFAVASELCKRGYEVAFTLGNCTPDADLIVITPDKSETFLVDVKGLKKRNPWLVKKKKSRKNLFYILAYVPLHQPNQFFVLTEKDAHKLIGEQLERLGRPHDYKVTGFNFNHPAKFLDQWKKLPGHSV